MTLDDIVHAISDIFDKNESPIKTRADIIRYFRENLPPMQDLAARDGCEFCLGAKGGVPGNENVIGKVVVCDYCTALYMKTQGK